DRYWCRDSLAVSAECQGAGSLDGEMRLPRSGIPNSHLPRLLVAPFARCHKSSVRTERSALDDTLKPLDAGKFLAGNGIPDLHFSIGRLNVVGDNDPSDAGAIGAPGVLADDAPAG